MKHESEIRVSWYPEDKRHHDESMLRLTDRIATKISNVICYLRDNKIDLEKFNAARDIRYACVLDPYTGDSLIKITLDPSDNPIAG